jgi:hypothetical protein
MSGRHILFWQAHDGAALASPTGKWGHHVEAIGNLLCGACDLQTNKPNRRKPSRFAIPSSPTHSMKM